MNVKREIRHQTEAGGGSFKGIPIHTNHTFHPDVAALITRYLSTSSSLLALDIGAGSGAFSRRLLDMGINVEAVELPSANWALPEIEVKHVDFCAPSIPVEMSQKYDIVVSIEVIEHVSDPLIFLRNALAALKPSGLAFITTPNTTSLLGVALMSWKRVFPVFDYDKFWNTGHRNLLPDFLLKAYAVEAGFDFLELTYGGRIPWTVRPLVSLIPILPVVLWQYLTFRKGFNKSHTMLVVRRPESAGEPT